MRERVQKFISNAGAASRRKAEEFIKSGQVFINGKKAKLGDKIDSEKDIIKVYGKIIKPAEQKIYLMMYKPKGYLVTRADPMGRKTAYALLPATLRDKVYSVGRLDFASEGLLLFTNDGDLTNQLTHPSFNHEKEYEVKLDKAPSESALKKLVAGVNISQGIGKALKARAEGTTLYITVLEGKKHLIRQMCDGVNLQVLNLKRIRVGKLLLPFDLPVGQCRLIDKNNIF